MTTEYVMVPVPEELVDDVQRMLAWRGTGSTQVDLDEAAIGALLDQLAPAEQRFLAAVARTTGPGCEHSISELAAELGGEPLHVFGLVLKLNQQLNRAGGLLATMSLLPNPDDGDDDLVGMRGPMAELVLRSTAP